MAERRRLRLPGRRAIAAASGVLVIGMLLGWAIAEVLRPDDAALTEVPYATATVAQGEVSQTLALNAASEWQVRAGVANRAAGTVTSVDVAAGAEASNGQRLYSVDRRPVSLARGSTPMYRDLAPGTAGPDVAQLQAMLAEIGIAPGRSDGTFDAATAAAVRSWQERSGIPVDATVRLADLVFLPETPARIRLDPATIFVGAILGGGEQAITNLGIPRFTVALDDLQSTLVVAGATATLTAPSGEWSVHVGERERSETGTIVTLETADGAPVCADACASDVAASGQTLFPARIVVVPVAAGLTVPSAAIATASDGSARLVDAEGQQHPVTVVASAQGISVVEGVTAGLVVRVPGQERSGR